MKKAQISALLSNGKRYSTPSSIISSFELEGFITISNSDWQYGGDFSFNGEENALPILGGPQSIVDNSSEA